MTDFQIPLSPEDLFSSFNTNLSYRVKKKPDSINLSPSECIASLNDLELTLKKDPTKIFSVESSENFDKIFELVLYGASLKLFSFIVIVFDFFCFAFFLEQ